MLFARHCVIVSVSLVHPRVLRPSQTHVEHLVPPHTSEGAEVKLAAAPQAHEQMTAAVVSLVKVFGEHALD